MYPLGLVHTFLATAALFLGPVMFLKKKGTISHRRWGYAYVGSMVGLNATAFMIYRLFGGFGPFHVAAVISSLTLAGGGMAVWRHRPGWLRMHYEFMAWSYIGLCGAAVAEIATRVPFFYRVGGFWMLVIGGSGVVFGVGSWLVYKQRGRIMQKYRGFDRKAL